MSETFQKVDNQTVNITISEPVVKKFSLEAMQKELAIAQSELANAQAKIDKWTIRISEAGKVGVS